MSVPSLRDQLDTKEKRQQVIEDAIKVLDEEVASKSGLSGMAVKAAYKLVQGIKPGFVRQVIDHLLDEFLEAMNPLYQEALEKGERPRPYLESKHAQVAEALLAVTDARARRAERPAIKKTYEKLRPSAHKHVEAAVPRLGGLLEQHALTQAPAA